MNLIVLKLVKVVKVVGDTSETVNKVPICQRGNLLYKQIYITTDQKLLYNGILVL